MQKIVFEDTTVVKSPYVTIDGVEYSVENGTYQGGTDLNANTFNTMQDNIEDAINNIPTSGGMPVGTINIYAGSTAPTGYMICDGSAVSRTTYSDLFDVIGTTYGSGDGSTTFNIPNLKGKVPVGLDSNDTDFDTIGKTYGEKTHTLTTEELPSMSFTVPHIEYSDALWQSNNITLTSKTGQGGSGFKDSGARANANEGKLKEYSWGSNTAQNNVQPSIVLNYIIKY